MSDIYRKNDKTKGILRRTNAKSKKDDNFVVKIDDAKGGKGSDLHSNRPMRNGEIYFANYQKNKSATAAKIYASSYDATPAESKKETKVDSDTKVLDPIKKKEEKKPQEATQLFEKARPADKAKPVEKKKTDSQQKTRLERATARKNDAVKKATESNRRKQNSKYDTIGTADDSGKSASDKKNDRKMKRAMRRSEPNYVKRLLLSIISVVLVTCLVSAIGIGCINDVLAINGTEEEISVTIPENATTGQIIRILKDEKLISNKLFCNVFAKFRGYGSDENYISGVYYLSSDMGLEGMLNEVQEHYTYSDEDTVSLSFPEGWTIQQIVDSLVNNEVIESSNKFMNALNFDYDYDFINGDENACFSLEGVMFPDTYEFYVGESASSIIRRFLDNFQEKWTAEYQQRADELGYSVTEILTIASIIQKEAADVDQMAGVSAVIHNRLKYSTDYPLLQCDSTGNYITKYLTGIVGESKANSYKKAYDTGDARTGLPAGPICNPGTDAIIAALYPDETSTYLYFCHDDNGKIYYANNDVEFARNVAEAEKVNEALDFQYN